MQTFRGVPVESDFRYGNRARVQLAAIAAPPSYDKPVKMSKVCRPVMDGWITRRLTELLGLEDEVVIGACVQVGVRCAAK